MTKKTKRRILIYLPSWETLSHLAKESVRAMALDWSRNGTLRFYYLVVKLLENRHSSYVCVRSASISCYVFVDSTSGVVYYLYLFNSLHDYKLMIIYMMCCYLLLQGTNEHDVQ